MLNFSLLVDFGAEGGVDREGWLDAAFVEVDAVEDLLAVGCGGVCFGAFEFEGEAAAVFAADGAPNALGEVVAEAGANGVALILRDPETAGDVADARRTRRRRGRGRR